jgi:hypothetical protein
MIYPTVCCSRMAWTRLNCLIGIVGIMIGCRFAGQIIKGRFEQRYGSNDQLPRTRNSKHDIFVFLFNCSDFRWC